MGSQKIRVGIIGISRIIWLVMAETSDVPSVTQHRLALAGAGGNSELRHIPNLQAIDGVTIVAVANRTQESAKKTAEKFSISVVFISHPCQDACLYRT